MTVTGEWVLLQNAAIDFGLLCAAALLSRLRTRAWALVLTALAGGLYAVLALYVPVTWSRLAVPLGLSQLALLGMGRVPWKRRAAMALWHFGCAGVLAGVTLGVSMLFRQSGFAANGLYLLPPAPMWVLTAGVLLGGVWLRAVAERRMLRPQEGYRGMLHLRLAGQPLTLPALVDSGCTLRDPWTGRGVVAVPRTALAKALPDWKPEVCGHVAFRTLSGASALPCVRPQQAKLTWEGRDYPLDALLALAPQEAGTAAAIVPPGLLI